MTRLTKPVTRARVFEHDGAHYHVTLDTAGIYFQRYRSPKRTALLLPYGSALLKAAFLAADSKLEGKRKTRRRRVRRGKL